MYGKQRARRGFTLVELMMVVVILGILAVVAIPRYQSYVYKSKTVEAVGFLAEIKARQESYRADFGQYCGASASSTAWEPDNNPKDTPRAWTPSTGWTQLGAVPPGRMVLFSYVSVAGAPGTSPDWGGGLGYNGSDFWFVSRALGDLDNDDTNVIFESYSHGQGLYIDREAGWE
jgi:prepilin-type N-terminal cleavage/methylation domain-containing protein